MLTRPARPPPMPPPSVGPRLLAATLTTLHKHDRKVNISLVEKDDIVQYNLCLILKTKKEILYTYAHEIQRKKYL